jgi:adenylate cyclase
MRAPSEEISRIIPRLREIVVRTMTLTPSSDRVAAPQSARAARLIAFARFIRARARLISALVLLSFVLCHLVSHISLIVSLPVAEQVLDRLMRFWRTETGTYVLATALAVHVLNALWSIYIRRYLRLSLWELAQLSLGLSIPPLLMLHVTSTKIADRFLGTSSDYHSILTLHWVVTPWLVYLQFAAVLTLWVHACIGLHFWLRTKRWYPAWLPILGMLGVLIPALALAGYVSGGNQILRDAQNPDFLATIQENAHETPETVAQVWHMALVGLAIYAGLVLLPFAGRGVRGFVYRMDRPPQLTHANGRTMRMLPGATVLETLRANGIPHASVCGGRARCTTCRIRVVSGQAELPEPAGLEAAALARVGATAGVRLACQIRPTADISVTPLLAADSSAADGLVRGGMEGSERLVTVVFIDLRGSTTLGEARMPYDVLFILNQFFNEMTKALVATGGHYSNFTGDGLMALYGLDVQDPALGAAQAVRGAREMLTRLDQLNAQLKADLKEPLRIGIGIHFGEAIVGALGPPGSQIVTAIGDTVNTTARLESLTKEYDCTLILSQSAAQAAGLDLVGLSLQQALVKGRIESVEFYALKTVPEAAL